MCKMIILDNGHGSQTPGKRSPVWADGSQLFEWEFNRDIVRRISARLKADGIRHEILVPEETDITLGERCRRANAINAACGGNAVLFSIHGNAGGGTGWECYTSVGNTKADGIATILCEEAEKEFAPDGWRMRFDHTDGDPDKERNILKLHEALLTKAFRTSEYDVFKIYEPKERVIYRLPYYPDRIVHHAIMNILEPIWVRTFTHNTFSCVKGRGIEGCARHVGKIIRKYGGKPLYCLKIDLKKYYPSIDHGVMKSIVRRKIKDKDLLWLIDGIIDSAEGLPIGNYLSQYLANLMLCYFMHEANEVLRMDCADDIVFFSDSKERLREAFTGFIRPRLAALRLEVKGNWQIFPIAENRQDKHGRALDYVGFKFYRKQKLIRKSIKQNFCRAAAKLGKRGQQLDAKAYKQAVAPWLGWARHSNSKHLLRTIIKQEHYESIL